MACRTSTVGLNIGGPQIAAFWRERFMSKDTNRRELLGGLAAGLALGGGGQSASAGSVPYRTLGSTGEKVSLIGVGGSHIGKPGEDEGIRIIRTAIDRGINFMDNSWDYND